MPYGENSSEALLRDVRGGTSRFPSVVAPDSSLHSSSFADLAAVMRPGASRGVGSSLNPGRGYVLCEVLPAVPRWLVEITQGGEIIQVYGSPCTIIGESQGHSALGPNASEMVGEAKFDGENLVCQRLVGSIHGLRVGGGVQLPGEDKRPAGLWDADRVRCETFRKLAWMA